MSTATTIGIVLLIVFLALIIILGVGFGIYFFFKAKNTINSPLLITTNNNNTTGNCVDFRPVVLTKCDLEKFCDFTDSCSSEFKLPPAGGKCDSPHSVEISCSDGGKDCFSSDSSSSCSTETFTGSNSDKSTSIKTISCNSRSDRCKSSESKSKSESCSINSGKKCHDCNNPAISETSSSSFSECNSSLDCGPCDMKFKCNAKDYYSAQDIKIVEFKDLAPNQILDITEDRNFIYALHKNGKDITIKNRKKQCKVTSKITLQRIIFFQGAILGVSSGKLYQQDPASVGRTTWYFFLLDKIPTGITWITKTLDGKYLWIQTSNKGYLYNCNLNKVSTLDINSNIQRFFGTSPEIIGDLNTNTHELTLVSCNKKFVNVGVAVFNPKNSIVYVRPQFLNTVKGIRIIRGRPYYLIN